MIRARFAAASLFSLTMLSPPIAGPLLGQQQAPNPCEAPEAHAFDFWEGEWSVYTPNGQLAGENSITREIGGCVLHERYSTPAGYAGESFNIYDASRGVWHQTWVDVGGLLLLIEGGLRDDRMVMEGETTGPNGTTRQRITWYPIDGNRDRVRQLWETSADGGATWTVAFDGTYKRKGTESN